MMSAGRFDRWWRYAFLVTTATCLSGPLGAQEARPAEVRSWLARQIPAPAFSVFGDVTTCTLVRCNQTASIFVSARSPSGLELTTGVRSSDLATQFGSRSALGSAYLGY